MYVHSDTLPLAIVLGSVFKVSGDKAYPAFRLGDNCMDSIAPDRRRFRHEISWSSSWSRHPHRTPRGPAEPIRCSLSAHPPSAVVLGAVTARPAHHATGPAFGAGATLGRIGARPRCPTVDCVVLGSRPDISARWAMDAGRSGCQTKSMTAISQAAHGPA